MKDQQQTLSVGISDALHRRFENARQMFSRTEGDSMSNSEAVAKAARAIARRLRESPLSTPKPVAVGRNLYVVFRDERLRGVEALNEVLRPYLPALFRIAAR